MRLVLLALLLAGCVRHIAVSPAELAGLNGFGQAEAPPAASDTPYQLTDRDGEVHAFTASSQLYLVDDHGQRQGGAFKLVQVDLKTLTGELVDGTHITTNLDALDRAELDVRDASAGVGLGLGIGLALVAIIVVGAMAMNGLP